MTPSTIYRGLFWIALLYSFYMFFAPDVDSGIRIPHIDKLGHFLAFAGLSFLLDFAYAVSNKALLFFTALYGLVVELIQSQLVGRSASIADYVADLIGAFCYLWFGRTIADMLFTRPKKMMKNPEQNNGQG